MFWVMFDTGTRVDYYRDVHNLLALPIGSTIRYDYRENHITDDALAEARGNRKGKVLLIYAQHRVFLKHDADPVGPLPYGDSLWIATRIADLSHIRIIGNRFYFDLELSGYPSEANDALDLILRPLADAGEVPFSKWIATSTKDRDLELVLEDEPSANWAATINRIGTPLSQFAGDSFWRVANITRRAERIPITPTLRNHVDNIDGHPVTTGVDAIYPAFELEQLAIQIESRMPEAGPVPAGAEPDDRRSVLFETSDQGPLREFNGIALLLRRYLGGDRVEREVRGTNRLDAQLGELTLTTTPRDDAAYPIGPELTIQFEISKHPVRSYLAILLAIGAAAALAVGGANTTYRAGVGPWLTCDICLDQRSQVSRADVIHGSIQPKLYI